jgi:hypothetical protein
VVEAGSAASGSGVEDWECEKSSERRTLEGFSLVVCVEEGGMEGAREGKEGGTVLRWGGRDPSSLSSLLSGYRERS